MQRAHHLTELDIAQALGKFVVSIAAKHDTNPIVFFFFVKRYARERPISAFIESLADRRIRLERKHHLTRRHDFTHWHRFQGQNILDNQRLLAVNDIFAEPETYQTIDIIDTHVFLVFFFTSPVLGEREAKPDNTSPRKNNRDVIERHRDQGRRDFRLLDAEGFRRNFAKQKNKHRKNNRE